MKKLLIFAGILTAFSLFFSVDAHSYNYCGSGNNTSVPPFLANGASPLVLFVMGRDHNLYYPAFNDATDINGDGMPDTEYLHSFDYYGYFDSYKCYKYDSSNGQFNPSRVNTDKYCGGKDEWSGNFLNWLSMSRIDIVRKVLYGGYRRVDSSSSTVLASTYIPKDSHTWGKEYYKQDLRLLSPFESNSFAGCTLSKTPVPYVNDKILMVTYQDGKEKGCGTNHPNLVSTFEPNRMKDYKYTSTIHRNDSGQFNPVGDHGNIMYVTEIQPSNNIVLTVRLRSDDGGEIEIIDIAKNKVVEFIPNYGCHEVSSFNTNAVYFEKDKWYRVIVRTRNKVGDSGAIVQFGRCNISLNVGILGLDLSLCINLLLPNLQTFSVDNLKNTGFRVRSFDTSRTEYACGLTFKSFVESGTPADGSMSGLTEASARTLFCMVSESANGADSDHRIKVAVNNSNRIWNWVSLDRLSCEDSAINPDGGKYFARVKVCDPSVGLESNCKLYPTGNNKPVGMLQKYGTGSGKKICSLTGEDSSSGCGGKGIEIDDSPIYFGMITGSYEKNMSGGVLRKRIGSISDEINQDGTFLATAPISGGIIQTVNALKINDYDFTEGAYNCGWILSGPMTEGKCQSWGNPLGEMIWEGLRYLAGKGSPSSSYTYSSLTDGGLPLPKPSWDDPSKNFPACSKPNIILLSDIFPNYDDDIPASGTFINYSKKDLFYTISRNENINGSYFVGNNGLTNNSACTPKNLTELDKVLGLCPEEPTKKGTYNSAALAYYGKTAFNKNADHANNITTYSIALSSPRPEIVVNAGGNIVKILPFGKTITGAPCNFITDSQYGVVITGGTFCPTNSIAGFYVEEISESGGLFRVNFEDMEQGADHDMDSIVRYDYKLNSDKSITVTIVIESQASSYDLAHGFIITGTTRDGTYLPLRTRNSSMWSWTGTFYPKSGGSNAQMLKNPLWYAAKYGGFTDYNGNGIPDLQEEWDANNDGIPDNYHLILNPKELEDRLSKVFSEIGRKVASGTSVSLDKSSNKGKVITQAVFYPEKVFGSAGNVSTVQWIGQILGYWFYNNDREQNMLEDTNKNRILDVGEGGDKIIEFNLEGSSEVLTVDKYQSTVQGAKGPITNSDVLFDSVSFLWNGGELLAERTAESRIVYTNVDGNITRFNTANLPNFLQMLGINLNTYCFKSGANLVSYILGRDIDGCRKRSFRDSSGNENIYKLGDILNSSPVLVEYPQKDSRGGYVMTFVGANDGMLHAFKSGQLVKDANGKQKLCDDTLNCSGSDIGKEMWAFIPKNALPYLRYYADPAYCHLYYNDLTPYVIEADMNKDGYVDKRILIGGMRLGGAPNVLGQQGSQPNQIPPDTCNNGDCTGFSSYYALDVTNPENPVLLWEKTEAGLNYSFSGPAYIKKDGKHFLMFTSGPIDYAGNPPAFLSVIVYELNNDFTIKSDGVTKLIGTSDFSSSGFTYNSTLADFKKTFSGKLFTTGVDFDGDGDTDSVFFGVSTGRVSETQSGNIIGVSIVNDNPKQWKFSKVFDDSAGVKPITTAVKHMKCFNNNFIVFGTGRWFFKSDQSDASGVNSMYGVNIGGCKDGNCGLSPNADMKNNLCNEGTSASKYYWKRDLRDANNYEGYGKERISADPAVSESSNVAFFSATMPDYNICTAGGWHSSWAINCSTGSNAAFDCKNNKIKEVPTVVVPTTAGGIIAEYPIGMDSGGFPPIKKGAALGEPSIIEKHNSSSAGRLLYWIEY